MNFSVDSLKYGADGLIPAIVQDAESGRVLMMAYMNAESLAISINEGRTCFYSRSRSELWRKGATSGNYQNIVGIAADCDGDTLLVKVRPEGPACHTGSESCFFNEITGDCLQKFSLDSLYGLLLQRKAEMPEGSYTSYLFDKGLEKILKKVGEECSEVIIGAMKNDKGETIYEIADLCYHVLVLMAQQGISVGEIKSELAGRHVIDHKKKQESSASGKEG